MKTKMLSIAAGIAVALAARTGRAEPAQASSADLRQMVQSRLTGQLALTVIEQDGAGYRVRAELQGGRFEQTPAPKQDVLEQLAKPFYFTINPSGEMQSFYFSKGLSADARALLKQLATSMQSVLPESPKRAWTTTERDVSGEYEASYVAEGNTLTRSKTHMLRANGLGGLLPMSPGMDYAVQSKAQVELAESGWPQRVTTDESYDVHLAGALVVATTRTQATLAETHDRPELAGHMPEAEVEAEGAANVRTALEARRQVDRQRVAGKDFRAIEAELGSPQKKVRDDAQYEMAALLRLSPADLAQAEGAVLKGSLDLDGKKRLMWALGSAGTPEAQATLVSILSSNDLEWRVTAAVTLGLLEHPTAASEQALLAAMSDREPHVAHTAMLGVGNLARTVTLSASAEESDHLVDPVIDALKQAHDVTSIRLGLESLGNSGHPKALAVIQPYLQDSNLQLRAVAVESLRFIPGQAVDAALAAALGDGELAIRRAAVSAVPYRPVATLLPALDSLMITETDQATRLAVINNLNLKRSETPDVQALLQKLSINHPEGEEGALLKSVLVRGN